MEGRPIDRIKATRLRRLTLIFSNESDKQALIQQTRVIMNVRAFFRLGLLVAIPWVDGSFAQVFSNNAVGYVNIGLKPGLNFVAVQLIGPDNSIASIFKNIQGGAPDGHPGYPDRRR